ncbi:MAG: hypothetical protein WBQ18_02745 [Solirubrobacteraceae bacterium]
MLALLEDAPGGGMTVAELRARGVRAPAQAVYTLQLAGYPIDHTDWTDGRGHRAQGYRIQEVDAWEGRMAETFDRP